MLRQGTGTQAVTGATMRDLFSRIRSVWWAFSRDTDCCDCKPGLERLVEDMDKEIEELTSEVERLKLENTNLKRELEFLE